MSENWQGFEKNEDATTSIRRLPLIIGVLLVLIVIGGFLFFRLDDFKMGSWGGLDFIIEFDETFGLTEGSPIQYRGISVGTVTKIEFLQTGNVGVSVSIDSEYIEQMRQGSTFRVTENKSTVSEELNYRSSIFVEIWVRDSSPIEEGMILQGASGDFQYYKQKIELLGKDKLEDLFHIGYLYSTTEITDDQQISQSLRLESGLWIPQELVFHGIFPSGEGWRESSQEYENFRAIIAEGIFSDPLDAVWGNSDILLNVDDTLFYEEYTYQQRFEPSDFQTKIEISQDVISDDFADLGIEILLCAQVPQTCFFPVSGVIQQALQFLGDQLSAATALPLENVQISATLKMPGNIFETNAHDQSGNTVYWNLTGSDINDGYVFFAKSRNIKLLPIISIALVLMLGVAAIIFLRKARSQPDNESTTFS